MKELSPRVCCTLLPFFLFSAGAIAETWSDSYRTIAHVYPHDDGVTFYLDGAVIVPSSPCPNRFYLRFGSPNYASKVAALLAAHSQGNRIQINYDETNTTCDVPVNRFITEN